MRALTAILFASLLSACSSPTTTLPGKGTGNGNGNGNGNGPGVPPSTGVPGDTVGGQCDTIGTAYCKHILDDCTPSTPGAGGATVGDQCNQLANTLCPKSVQCGTDSSLTSCTTSFVGGCCQSGGLCAAVAASTADTVNACATALSQMTCADLGAKNTPSSCKGIVKPVPTPQSHQACLSQLHDGCCGTRGACGESALSSSSSIDACVQAIDAQTCSSTSTLPAACQGAVKMTSVPIHLESEAMGGARLAPRMFDGRGLGDDFAAIE